MTIAHTFFEAFSKKDYKVMSSCYHPEATFSDPIFINLNADEVKAMWQMLLNRSQDLELSYTVVELSSEQAMVRWVAQYSFSKTGRRVTNTVQSQITYKDNYIYSHNDTFGIYAWCRMALGPVGTLLGWTTPFQNKIRHNAQKGLSAFMNR